MYHSLTYPLFKSLALIENFLDMSDWSSLCLQRIAADHLKNILFVYIFSVSKYKITQPYAQKLVALIVNNNEIVNKIVGDLGKVTKSTPNLEW